MCTVYTQYIEFYVQQSDYTYIWIYIIKHNFHRAVCNCMVICHKIKKDIF